jgi:hypothetical protein
MKKDRVTQKSQRKLGEGKGGRVEQSAWLQVLTGVTRLMKVSGGTCVDFVYF